MFHWNTKCVYLFLHESIHKVNYNHNIRYSCIQRCNHYDLIRKKKRILSVGRRGRAVLYLPSILLINSELINFSILLRNDLSRSNTDFFQPIRLRQLNLCHCKVPYISNSVAVNLICSKPFISSKRFSNNPGLLWWFPYDKAFAK